MFAASDLRPSPFVISSSLVPREAQDPPVQEHDGAVGVQEHHAERRRLEDPGEPPLTTPRQGVLLLEGRDAPREEIDLPEEVVLARAAARVIVGSQRGLRSHLIPTLLKSKAAKRKSRRASASDPTLAPRLG
jgi:hypothetical protein